jgi:HSP20 family molecular chaperone IbpA
MDKQLQRTEKQEITGSAEQTRPGPIFMPAVDIFENNLALTVLADLPGVKAKNLKIDLRDNILTLTATVDTLRGEGEVDLFREYESGTFFRQFTLAETIDQAKIDAKIDAELRDGVLRLQLPKTEAAKPRQIAVKLS